ncbi:hypothetical protein Tco_0246178 [Tanacetum coccineum]
MWNTLQLADSKEEFKSIIDEEEVTFSLNDLRTVLKLTQATDNDHTEFVEALDLGTMIKFLNILGHAVESLHFQLMNPSTKNMVVPYTRFTKLIIDHILTTHHKIPKRLNEPHHLVAHDDVVQSIFASENFKGRGMGIPDYLLTQEIMQTEAYRVYAANFKLVILMMQPQPAVSSQGTHRTPSAPRSPNPRSTPKKKKKKKESESGESSVPKNPLKIKIRWRQPDPEAPIPISAQEAEAQANVKIVEQHLLDEDVNKIVEGDDATTDEFADSVLLSQEDPDTRIDLMSDKERPKGDEN